MEPPLSVQFRIDGANVYAFCPELELRSSGKDGCSALEQLASSISEYWAKLEEDDEFRSISPHKEHYELFLQKILPFIHEMEEKGDNDALESLFDLSSPA